MEDPSEHMLISVAFVSFGFAIVCSLLKGAYTNFSPAVLEELLETEKGKAQLPYYLAKTRDFLVATNIVGTLASMVFIASIVLLFTQQGKVSASAVWYSVALAFVPLACAKSIPEALAQKYPKQIMRWGFPLMLSFYWGLIWISWPVSKLILRFNSSIDGESRATSAELEKELLHVVSEGAREGFLQGSEKSMIESIIDLRDVEAKEIMTPRTDMICISTDSSMEEAIKLAKECGHSRIPIYQENRDDVVGIFYIKDLLHHWDDPQRDEISLDRFMRKPYFIPETKRIGSLLKEFQEQKLHIAVVLDEYGGTAGIVTIEDIIEEIVGDIRDEYDAESFEPICSIDEDVTEVSARVRVEDLNEALGINLPMDNGYETIGGFLFSHLEKIPTEGDTYIHENLEFTILNASDRRINRIRIAKISGSG